mmetsp:Transcript_46435/g.132359  ORF Transcript_46435/g.132359 Transcript_46435/m.132359 type:complete len:269 (+) Transcript_46435:403-1209(+)
MWICLRSATVGVPASTSSQPCACANSAAAAGLSGRSCSAHPLPAVVRCRSAAVARCSARATRFSNSTATGLGPTPPGTGVMRRPSLSIVMVSRSPIRPPASGSNTLPTLMSTAPAFTTPRSMSPGEPTADTTTSAAAHSCRNSGGGVVLVTVDTAAPSLCSMSAIGAPHSRLFPMTTACLPVTVTPARSRRSITLAGVVGRTSGAARRRPRSPPPPGVARETSEAMAWGLIPSMHLPGSTHASSRSASSWSPHRILSGSSIRMPSTVS